MSHIRAVGLVHRVSTQTCLKEVEHPLVSVPENLGGESMPLHRVNVHVTFQFCLRAQLRKLKRVVHRNIRVFTPVEDEQWRHAFKVSVILIWKAAVELGNSIRSVAFASKRQRYRSSERTANDNGGRAVAALQTVDRITNGGRPGFAITIGRNLCVRRDWHFWETVLKVPVPSGTTENAQDAVLLFLDPMYIEKILHFFRGKRRDRKL